MNYNNMYSNRTNNNIDPNYIYPQPYIDPLMYMNPYTMNNSQMGNFNPVEGSGYTTYFNQYVDNPQFNPYENMNNDMNMNNNMNNIPMIPMMPPNMMYPGIFPPNMMFPSMPPNMSYQGMVYPGAIPPNMMFPGVMQNIPTVNMDEFDEEEM